MCRRKPSAWVGLWWPSAFYPTLRATEKLKVKAPFLLRHPCVEFGLIHGLDDDLHRSVARAAELRALAAPLARLVDLQPGEVVVAGHGVGLARDCRHPPRVDDVVGAELELDQRVRGHDERH